MTAIGDAQNILNPATATSFARKSLTSITIPNSVTTIGYAAFSNNQLTTLTIPSSVTTIGYEAFYGNQLTTLHLGNSVTTIGNSAFASNQLTTLQLGNSVTTIGSLTFERNQLTSVTILNPSAAMQHDSFVNNPISSMVIGSTTYTEQSPTTDLGCFTISGTGITEYYQASPLIARDHGILCGRNVTIPNSVTTIGYAAFSNNQLTSVTIPNSVTTIGYAAFSNNQLTTLQLGNSVTTIGIHAFEGNKITSVTLPDSVTTIGDYAFSRNQLTSVTIPDSVTAMGYGAFQSNRLTVITIPNSITSLGNYVFRDNQLTTITIPDSITSIGVDVFTGQMPIVTTDQASIPNPLSVNGDPLTSPSATLHLTGSSTSFGFGQSIPYGDGKATRYSGTLTVISTAVDFTPPIITLPETSTTILRKTDFDELAGVIATDDVDGNIPLTMDNVSMDINPSTPAGTYTLTYTVKDSAGNTATATRTVRVVDNRPTITLPETSTTILRKTDFDELAGVIATDDVDGNIPLTMDNVSMDINPSTPAGTYTLTYAVKDSAGNEATARRYVYVVDRAPVITLPEPQRIDVVQGVGFDELAGVSATDDIDGDIPLTMANVSMDITPETPVKLANWMPTYYIITYTVKDSAGNTATAHRYVTVTYNQPPQITMKETNSNTYDLYIKRGAVSSINLLDKIDSITDDVDGELNVNDVKLTLRDRETGDETPIGPSFTIPDQLGRYEVDYRIKDSHGNEGYTQGYITVYDVEYQQTITNDTLPSMEGSLKGLDFDILSAYILPADTEFNPEDPGDVMPHFVMANSITGKWQIVTDKAKAKEEYREFAINRRLAGLSYEIKRYLIPEATFSDPPTIDEIKDYCSDQRLRDGLGATDESACRDMVQQYYDMLVGELDEYIMPQFDEEAENYDWTPFADGAYDVYIRPAHLPMSERFGSGLIIDTTKPEVSITLPPSFLSANKMPALTGRVNEPGATVIVTINGKSYTARNNGDGTWTLPAGTIDQLPPGEYNIIITATDRAGNEQVTTTKLTVNQAPESPSDLATTGASVWTTLALASIVTVSSVGLLVRRAKN